MADNSVASDELRVMSAAEGMVLEVDDNVTLSRIVNMSQVRAKIIDVTVSNNGIITYEVRPQNGAILLAQSEYLMVKSSTATKVR